MPVTILRTRDGKLDAADRPAMDALVDRLGQGPKKILLHLHGGLVSQRRGEEIAERLSGDGPNSYSAPEEYEQIYVVWRTGAFETIKTNWRDLFENDRLYRALFKHLIGYMSSKVMSGEIGGGRSVGLLAGLSQAEIERRLRSGADQPFADLDQMAQVKEDGRSLDFGEASDIEIEGEFAAVLQQSSEFNEAVEDLAASVVWEAEGRAGVTSLGDAARGRQSLARLSPDLRAELSAAPFGEEGRGLIASTTLLKSLVKHATKIALRVVKRLRSGRGHGIHATIVEEILRELYGDLVGAAIWGMMKRDAFDHFSGNSLGAELAQAIGAGEHQPVVVGHSAGSIWAAAMLGWIAKAPGNFPKLTLLLLAPAVRMVDFAAAIAGAHKCVEKFRIFTMTDELERADAVLGHKTGMIYPSSLLYLVSGLFEETGGKPSPDAPLLGMQRFLGRDPAWLHDATEEAAVTAVRTFVGEYADGVIYSIAHGGPGKNTDATAHGDFDDNPATLGSVRTFL